MTEDVTRPLSPSKWVLVLDVAAVVLVGVYIWVLIYPDETERGMRCWSWASKACYTGASALGKAGMACERHYLAMTNG